MYRYNGVFGRFAALRGIQFLMLAFVQLAVGFTIGGCAVGDSQDGIGEVASGGSSMVTCNSTLPGSTTWLELKTFDPTPSLEYPYIGHRRGTMFIEDLNYPTQEKWTQTEYECEWVPMDCPYERYWEHPDECYVICSSGAIPDSLRRDGWSWWARMWFAKIVPNGDASLWLKDWGSPPDADKIDLQVDTLSCSWALLTPSS